MTHVISYLEAHQADYLDDLREFVGIPSVSTDPQHAGDVRRAAVWVADRLRAAGPVEVEVIETAHHPAVFGRWNGRPGAPTVLVYGHLDVQPPDPLGAWDSPPFELTERNGRLYGRGVSDDKASMLIPILVTEAFFQQGSPPVNLRFLFEAEEEIGSPSLPGIVRERAEALGCDVVLSADGGMWRADVPSLTLSARGMVALEMTVRSARKDLHSGRHGGGIQNPLHALAELIASLHVNGRVAVEGFYDDVIPPSAEQLASLERLDYDDEAYLAEIGAPATFGEPGFGTLARQWLRPTLEVNGVGGGYQGPGTKTVIPADAFAKITCRLVAGQDPDAVLRRVRKHLEAHVPPGATLEVTGMEAGAEAYRISEDHFAVQAAAAVLADAFGQAPALVGMGGSVPICSTFKEALGAETLFFSFSTGDEDIHAPNEFYRPERFRMGLQAWAKLWERLGNGASAATGDASGTRGAPSRQAPVREVSV